jgi:3-hydroxybutyryl-CoA dehydrogenase
LDIDRVGVVGGGVMGSGIAETCARAGLSVVLCEQDQRRAEAASERITGSLDRAVKREKITSQRKELALSKIKFVTELESLGDRQLVLEAVIEDRDEKRKVFAELDDVVGSEVILATNTSSMPVTDIAAASRHPERVLGIHFFNPVPVMRLVEIVPTLLTAPHVTSAAETFASETLGKHIVQVTDRAGFIVNALLVPMLLNAVRMLESGVASASEIDDALVLAFDHPMGPLRLCDLIGVDIVVAMAESLYAEFGEPTYCPPPTLRRMKQAGRLGRKTGRGFFDYES